MRIIDTIAAFFKGGQDSARSEIANVAYSDAVMDAFGVSPGASGMSVTPVSAMRVAAVFACVQKIAGAIATLPIHTYKTDGDIKARQPRDDLWFKLNEQPSPQFTAASHWEGVSIAQLLRGDAYTWIRRGMNNSVRELLPLPWGCVSPMRQTDGSVRYYIHLPDYGINTWLEPSEILHFPGFGFDGLKSMSVITHAAKAAVGNALAMDEYSGKFFANGAHPSIVLTAPGKMSPDQIELLQGAFVKKYAGLENAHKIPLVLTEGLAAKEISLSAEDAQLLEARKFQVIDIARAFGVPPHMIGETSASTSWGSGIESMSRGFVTYTLQPHLVRIEQELNRKLFPRDTGRFVQFDRDALIEGDSAAQAAYNRAALGGPGTGMGWMSVDEIRKTKGLAPLGGSSEEIFDPRDVQQPEKPDTSKQDKAVEDVANVLRDLKHANELQTERISNRLENQPQQQPVINMAPTNISLDTKGLEEGIGRALETITSAHADKIKAISEEMQVTVNVPEQPAPIVNVNVEAPIVNMEAIIPKQDAPIVNVAAPVIHNVMPDSLRITGMPDRVTTSTVARDSAGNITKAVQTEKDA